MEIRKALSIIFVGLVVLLPCTVMTTNLNFHHDGNSLDNQFLSGQYIDLSPIEIVNNSGFQRAGFSGSGSEENPYLIENVQIIDSTALFIQNTTAFFIVRGSKLLGEFYGISLFNVSNGRFEDCEFQGTQAGISAINSSKIMIDDCEFLLSSEGIHGENLYNGTISNSRFHHNAYGIQIISGNNTRIESCTFSVNSDYGVNLDDLTYNTTVFSSNFCWNGQRILGYLATPRNANDSGRNNTWTANRWSDYEGNGPYTIQGGSGARDIFATLIADVNAPSVDGPDDIRYDEGATGNWLNWNATDEFPAQMILYINGIQSPIQDWTTENFQLNVDGYPLGSHNITILYIDAAGNSVSDEVWVAVMISIFGSEGTEYVFYASITSMICVAVLLIVIKRMR